MPKPLRRPAPARAPAFADLIETAHTLADRSARAILPYFRKQLSVDDKGHAGAFDPVTAADKAAERAIARALARTHPDHGIVGEEYGSREGTGRFRWIVDPIDGTKAFIMGSPLWGTLVGLLDGEAPVLGLMNQPFTRERVWSGPKQTFWRVGDAKARRVETRPCRRLADAILTTTSPELLGSPDNHTRFSELKSRVRMTRYGGDCYHYALLAAGGVDLVVEAGLKAHDVVALIPIVERAGGRITTWSGGPATGGGAIVAAGDARMHAEALAILGG